MKQSQTRHEIDTKKSKMYKNSFTPLVLNVQFLQLDLLIES